MSFRIKAAVHGVSGVGKSWLGASTPGPRLILDAEGGSKFAKQSTPQGNTRPPAKDWDPRQPLPEIDDPNTSVFVRVRTIDDMNLAYAVLASGNHYFNSVVVDSLTEIQLKLRKAVNSEMDNEVTSERGWGILLDRAIDLCCSFRDLTDHPTKPLWAVVILAISEQKGGIWVPQVQGGLRDRLAGYFDIVGWYSIGQDPGNGQPQRQLHIQPGVGHVAKDRTDDLTLAYGPFVPNPSISDMLLTLNAQETANV